jgi:hypothetical protein
MRVRDIESNQSSSANPLLKPGLRMLDRQFKPFLRYVGSAVPIAFVFSGSAVWAKGQVLVFPTFQNSAELSTPLHSAPADENYAIANYAVDFDQSVSTSELHPSALSGSDGFKQSADLAEVQNQAASLAQPPKTAELTPPNRVAQADTSTPESVSTPQNAPAPSSEPPSQSPDAPASQNAPTPPDEPSAPPSEPSEPASNPAASNQWRFSVEPYFFVPLAVEGDVTVAGRSASINLDLGDILNLDRAFDAGLRFEAQHNRLGFILDGFYVSAADSGSTGVTLPAGSLQRFGINFPVRVDGDVNISIREFTLDSAVSYRVVDTVLGRAENFYPRLVVAPIVGLRTKFLWEKVGVENVRIGDISLPVDRSYSSSRNTVEPLIGAQIGLALSQRWAFNIRGDVSGFNINADQDFTWNLFVGTQYSISPSISLQLAYRFNGFDFQDGEGIRRTRLNLYQNGITLSGIFRF